MPLRKWRQRYLWLHFKWAEGDLLNEVVADVIAHLDDFERDMAAMAAKVKEYRYILFAAMQAEGLDSDLDGLLDSE